MKAMKIEKCWGFSKCKTIGTALWYDDESPEGLWMCASCAAEWEMSAEAPAVTEDDDNQDGYCGACGGSGGEHPMFCRDCGGTGEARTEREYDWASRYDRAGGYDA